MIMEGRSLVYIIYVTPGFHLGGMGEFTSSSEVVTMSCSEHCSSCAQYSWMGKRAEKGRGWGGSYFVVYHAEVCLSFRIGR